jgi:hypothetical protein
MDSDTKINPSGSKVLIFDRKLFVEKLKIYGLIFLITLFITVPAFWIGRAIIGDGNYDGIEKLGIWFFGVAVMICLGALSVPVGGLLLYIWHWIVEECNCICYVPEIESINDI